MHTCIPLTEEYRYDPIPASLGKTVWNDIITLQCLELLTSKNFIAQYYTEQYYIESIVKYNTLVYNTVQYYTILYLSNPRIGHVIMSFHSISSREKQVQDHTCFPLLGGSRSASKGKIWNDLVQYYTPYYVKVY